MSSIRRANQQTESPAESASSDCGNEIADRRRFGRLEPTCSNVSVDTRIPFVSPDRSVSNFSEKFSSLPFPPPSLCSFASLSLYFCLSLHVLRDRWLVRSYLNSRSSCGIHLAPCTVCAPFDSKVSNSECTSQWKSSRDDQHISQQRNKQTSANSGLPFGFGRGIERVGGKDVIFSRFASASAKRRRTEFAEDSALSLDP